MGFLLSHGIHASGKGEVQCEETVRKISPAFAKTFCRFSAQLVHGQENVSVLVGCKNSKLLISGGYSPSKVK